MSHEALYWDGEHVYFHQRDSQLPGWTIIQAIYLGDDGE